MIDEHSLPGEPANRGWNRASIIFWSRKPYRPRIRREDLALPKHLDGLRLVGSAIAAGASVTAFFVWVPLFFVTIFAGLDMATFAVTLAAAFVALSIALYFWVVSEKRRSS
jgi:hypothetical protein